MRHPYFAAIVAVLVVGAGTSVGGLSASADADAVDVPDVLPTGGDGIQRSCDYAALYDETIGSVVAIRTAAGQGSGFVHRITGNGTSYLVTNAHVVGDAKTVRVQFLRDETRTGEVVGRSRHTDLAVVRVGRTPDYVDALSIASTAPPHGRRVAALGSPLGLDETMTHGIVSGVNRSLPTDRGVAIPDAVQTDAPINPGNSGGPLVNCEGTVVGVNTAGVVSDGVENVGFAVSAPLADRVVTELIRTGDFDPAALGIDARPVSPALARANDLDVTGGVYVESVRADGPAAGELQGTTDRVAVDGRAVPVGGDVVVAVEGRPVDAGRDLATYLLTEATPGEPITLTVVRDGRRRQVEVTPGERSAPAT